MSLAEQYEDLANHFAKRGESRQRDQCLVLAADAALRDDRPLEAERLRRRLLLTNANHLLRPYRSMAEAMQSNDVREYVADLRLQWPPDMVAKLLGTQTAPSKAAATYPIAEPMAKPEPAAAPVEEKPRPASKLPAPPSENVTGLSFALSLFMFALGLVLAGGLFAVTFAWP